MEIFLQNINKKNTHKFNFTRKKIIVKLFYKKLRVNLELIGKLFAKFKFIIESTNWFLNNKNYNKTFHMKICTYIFHRKFYKNISLEFLNSAIVIYK